MKVILTKASDLEERNEIELNSLEELKTLVDENYRVVINSISSLEDEEIKNGCVLEVVIYDDYLE